jgi:type I restriction enzyme S subunit
MKKGWKVKRLGELGAAIREQAKIVADQEYELWSVPSFETGTPETSFGKGIGSAKLLVRPNDVLICKINPRINRVWLVEEPVNGREQIGSTEWLVFRANPDAGLSPTWLIHFVSAPKFREWIESEVTGATGSHTRAKADGILRQEIPVPPLAEQQRIVGLLDEAFEGLATAKANAEKNLQNARALFESHLQSVFTQRGPGWVETTLDKISTNLDNKRVPITKNVRTSGEYPYYGASGIVDYVGDYIFEGANLLVSEDGANLLARSTPIAFSVSGKYWVNNHAHILHFENMATQRFAEFYLESIKLDDYITGAAQPKLNQKALNSILIPIPKSVETQAKIVESVESLQEETQRLARLYERKHAALEALKKSLLHQAFTGAL